MPEEIETLDPTDISTDDEAQSEEVDQPVEDEVVEEEEESVDSLFGEDVEDEDVKSDPRVAKLLESVDARHEQSLSDTRKDADDKAETQRQEDKAELEANAYSQALDARSLQNARNRANTGAGLLDKYFKDAVAGGIESLTPADHDQLSQYFDGQARTQISDETEAQWNQLLGKEFPDHRPSVNLTNALTTARGQGSIAGVNQARFDIIAEAVREKERPQWETERETEEAEKAEDAAQAAETKKLSDENRNKSRPPGDLSASTNGALSKAAVEKAMQLPTDVFLARYDVEQRKKLFEAVDKLGAEV